jgi:hypothetical protein
VDTGSFRLALDAALGVVVAPYVRGKAANEPDAPDIRAWYVGPMMTLGLLFGA